MSELWDRLPLPAEHIVPMAASLVLLRMSSRRLPMALSALGWPLAAAGVAVNVWALRSRGGADLERPADLVTIGAYAWSRNPMYVGWSLMHVGVGLGARSPWMVASWPIAAVLVHGQILREEQWLAARFADAFTTYVDHVPRYACAPWVSRGRPDRRNHAPSWPRAERHLTWPLTTAATTAPKGKS